MMPQRKKALIVASVRHFLASFEKNDVKLLQEMGYEVHYAANLEEGHYPSELQDEDLLAVISHAVPIQRSPFAFRGNFKSYRMLCRLMKEEQFSLIHCHTPMGGVLARLAARAQKEKELKVLYTAHGFHFYEGASFHYWLLYYRMEHFLARFTDRLITINREDYERAKRFPLRAGGKAELIPGIGVRTELYHTEPSVRENMRQELGLSETDFFVLAVGELNKNKNHQVLLRTLAKLSDKNIFLGICGAGEERDKLLKLSAELGVTNRVTLFGYRRDIPRLLAAADCLAHPSLREGLGLAPLEALAAGVPVLVSEKRGSREYLESGKNGFHCKNTPESYAKAILYLKNNPSIRKSMSEHCMKTAERFSLSQTEKCMRRIYKEYSTYETKSLP